MAARRVRRGFARRAELRAEGEARNEIYRALSLNDKIEHQRFHDGRQLAKLLKERKDANSE